MDLTKAITSRFSVRGYKPDPVSKKSILDVLEIARWSPSGMNFQPWEFAVVTGPQLDEIKKMVQAKRAAAPMVQPQMPPAYAQRRAKQIEQITGSMGGPDAYQAHMKTRAAKGNMFYGAPAAIFIYNEKAFGVSRNLDAGLLVQTILLVAHDKGLGCCVMGASAAYAEDIRQILKLPDTKQIVTGLAIGYADMNAPENGFPRMREPVESLISWFGF